MFGIFSHAIVEELAGLGAKVHTCSRNETHLNDCLHEWQAKGFQVTGTLCDVSSRVNREDLMNKVSSLFNGKLHILVSPLWLQFYQLILLTSHYLSLPEKLCNLLQLQVMYFSVQINNVGTAIGKPTLKYTAEDFSYLMGTNFESAYHMCQLAYPLLKASGAGSIVFVSSVSGVLSVNIGTIYGAAKGAFSWKIFCSNACLFVLKRI